MITNFDSTMQKQSWESTLRQEHDRRAENAAANAQADVTPDELGKTAATTLSKLVRTIKPALKRLSKSIKQNKDDASLSPVTNTEFMPIPSSTDDVWLRDGTHRTCEQLLNAYTVIATEFAGVIRTAYMYCTRIMLTDAQLFDGMFFLTLGPTAVNGILGKSYKDGPSIILSGRKPTLEQCLESFTLATIGSVRQAMPADAADTPCEGDPDQYTLRPLEYCVFDRTLTHQESLSFSKDFYDTLNARLDDAHHQRNGETVANVIAESFARALHPQDDVCSRYRFLAQRWQEWIDAERQGLILYEDQKDPVLQARVASPGFDKCFEDLAKRYIPTLLAHHHVADSSGADVSKSDMQSTVQTGAQPTSPSGLPPASTSPMPANAADTKSDAATFVEALHTIAAKPKRSNAFMFLDHVSLPEGNEKDSNGGNKDTGTDTTATAGTQPALTRQALRDWYQFIYQRALATHLGVQLIAVAAPDNSFETLVGEMEKSNRSSLVLDGGITVFLGGMPFNRFSTFCYESRSTIRRWRNCTPESTAREQRNATRGVAYAVQQATEEHSLSDDRKSIYVNTFVAAILALITALFDNVWFNGSTPMALVVLVAWVIAVIPNITEMIKWRWGVHSSEKTVVYLK